MAVTEKTISSLIGQQLPDFIRADHPQFKRFLELYYAWLEDETKGNTVYHIMNAEKYRDIDNTQEPFVKYFKQELLPYFPETSALDLTKILKGAREFYVKKGSEESVKWLFRVLFDQEVEVYYPKNQILIASDGKWKLPQAFTLTLSAENQSIDPNLLEKHKGTGSESTATCIIESANRTVDKTFGNEILEIYVSNVSKEFINGEQLEIVYVDANGVVQTFSEKIIGAISGIRIDSTIKTDPQQKRRGLLYNVGDPVVVYGGLDNTAEANDAVAVVGNVSVGSIEGLTINFPGYGYRLYSNTETVVYRTVGDDPNANQSTDIRVTAINQANTAQSQNNYLEVISIDKMPVDYLSSVVLSTSNYTVLTQNNRNILIDVDEADSGDIYYNLEDVYANGASYETANFKGKILNSNSSGFGQGGAAYGGPLVLYAVSNTVALTTTGFLAGQQLYTRYTAKSFTVNTVDNVQLPANINSQIIQTTNYVDLQTGGLGLFDIINGGYGFRSTPTITVDSYFDTYLSENYAYGTAGNKAHRQPMSVYGHIAHVYVQNGGTGYANGDAITVSGRGYGFTGFVNVNSTGAIQNTTITNRGEGYYGAKTVTVSTSGGSGATLQAYGFGEGATWTVDTGAIGRVKDVRMVSRGFDYVSTPVVSLKVVDMVINAISESENLDEGERVYQGASLATAVFQGIVKKYNRSTNNLRLFNYSGNSFTNFNSSLPFTSEGGVTFTVDTTATVAAPAEYPAEVRAAGLPNPYFYGNGKARAVAEFFNGLIKFPGFYLNTDGFLSADKKTQDDKVYHNYSYIIESEKSLNDYERVIKDIVHPVGMSMLGRTTVTAEVQDAPQMSGVIYTSVPQETDTNVTAYAVDTNNRAIINGTTTHMANANDMIVINSNSSNRVQVKRIISVANTANEATLEIDFTSGSYSTISNNAVIITMESNTAFLGDGRLRSTNVSNVLYVSSNSSALTDTLAVDDVIRFKPADYRTNKVLWSENVANSTVWTVSGTTAIGNDGVAPDGTTTATRITETATTAQHYWQQTHSWTAGNTYFVSTHAKGRTGANLFSLHLSTGAFGGSAAAAVFDLNNGLVLSLTGATTANAGIETANSGYYRCWISQPATITGGSVVMYYAMGDLATRAGSTSNTIYVWGDQIEDAESLGPYVKTTTAPVKGNVSSNVYYVANVVAISGNTIQVNTKTHLITSNSSNVLYEVYPFYENVNYDIIHTGEA